MKTKISQRGVVSGPMPRIYANKVVLNASGASIAGTSAAVDSRLDPISLRLKDGSLAYRSSPIQSSNKTLPQPVQTRLQVYVQDAHSGYNAQGSWLNTPLFRNRIKIKVIQSTNKKLTQDLIRNFNINTLQRYNLYADYQVIETSLQKNSNETDNIVYYNNGDLGKIASLVKDFVFLTPFSPEHLTYFFVCERNEVNGIFGEQVRHGAVTVERVIEDFSVIKNSLVLREATGEIWAGPTHLHPGTGWMEGYEHTTTPHQAFLKDVVNNFKVADLRILQEVRDLDINILAEPPMGRADYVSDLYVSRTADDNMGAVFDVNLLQFLSDRSKFGGLVSNAKAAIQKDIMARSMFSSLRIRRDRVKSIRGINRLESAADIIYDFDKREMPHVIAESSDGNSRFISQNRYVSNNRDFLKYIDTAPDVSAPVGYNFFSSISEINLGRSRAMRTFQLSDAMASVDSGVYQYEVEIQIKDGSYAYLRDRLRDLEHASYGMKNYLSLASMPSNFSSRTNKFVPAFADSQLDEKDFLIPNFSELTNMASVLTPTGGDRPIQVWVGSIVKYIEALDILTNISDDQKRRLVRALYFLISPTTGSPDGIEEFIELLELLTSQLGTLLSSSPRHLRDKSDISNSSRPTEILVLDAKFAQTFDATALQKTGFEYFGAGRDNRNVLSVTPAEFSSTIQSQLAKISDNVSDPSSLQSSFEFIDYNMAAAFYSTTGSTSFVAPSGLQLVGNKINLWSQDSLDFISITGVIQNMVRNSTSRFVDVAPELPIYTLLSEFGKGPSEQRLQNLNKMYVDNAISSGIQVQIQAPPMPPASSLASSADVLGSDNKFATTDVPTPSLTAQVPANNPEDVLAILDRVLEIDNVSLYPSFQSTMPPNISFDLNKPNNFFTQTLQTSLNFKGDAAATQDVVRRIESLPPHIRRLASKGTRYYSDMPGSFATTDDAQTDGFIYNFGMIRVVEYLAGYERGIVKSPIWKKVDPAILDDVASYRVCRVRQFTDPHTNIGVYEITNRLPVYNEHFLLGPSSLPSPGRPRLLGVSRLRADGLSYGNVSFVRGPERDVLAQLLTFEAQQKLLGNQIEYTMTEAPLPPGPRTITQPATMTVRQASSANGSTYTNGY